MDFSFPAEVAEFRAELRAWLAAHLTGDIMAAGQRGPGDPAAFEAIRAWNAAMADAGWAAVAWPQEYGGRGATPLEQLVYLEETTRARAPLPVNVIGLNNIAPAIMQYGTEQQKRELLPRMMRADDIWCQGMSEPETGSDLASLRTRAAPDGGEFVVTGQKTWTSLGHKADWCQLFVRTDADAPKHQGISCLVVDMTWPGIQARPIVGMDGEAHFAEVFFDDVRVPADALLGPLNQGWQVATTTLSHERAGAARLYAETQVRLEDLVADLAGAETDGRPALDDPIGAFQAVQHLCADMYETVELARGGVFHALWAADAAAADERHLAAVRIKAFAGRLATVGETAIQVFGGIGYTWEHDAHLYLKRLLSWSAFLGAPDWYLREVGSCLARNAHARSSTP